MENEVAQVWRWIERFEHRLVAVEDESSTAVEDFAQDKRGPFTFPILSHDVSWDHVEVGYLMQYVGRLQETLADDLVSVNDFRSALNDLLVHLQT